MKNRHTIFLILAICVTIFVGTIYGYMYSMINTSLEKTVKLQTDINSISLTKNQEQNFMQSYKSTASEWASLPSFFVENGHIVDFIEAIEILGVESNSKVTMGNIDSDNLDGSPVGKEGTIRTHISAEGSWNSVMRALALAETLPYKITIENVRANTMVNTIESAKATTTKETSKVVWNLSFDMKVAMIVGSPKSTTSSGSVSSLLVPVSTTTQSAIKVK